VDRREDHELQRTGPRRVRTRVTFGSSQQGWNRRRAEIELEKILQQVERGIWVPPAVLSKEERRTSAMAELGVRLDERFSVFATRWWKSKRLRIADRTISNYEWRLSYLQRFFGRYELNEIDVALVDRFRDELHEHAATIRAAIAYKYTGLRLEPGSRRSRGG
jgi:hypothetical protein